MIEKKEKVEKKRNINDVVDALSNIEDQIEDRYPYCGKQMFSGAKADMIDILIADFILSKKAKFISAIKKYNKDMNDFMSSQEYNDQVVDAHKVTFGDSQTDEKREEAVGLAIKICKDALSSITEEMVNLANNDKKIEKAAPSSVPKGGIKLKDIDGNDIAL